MAEEVWMLQTKKADFKQIGARFQIDPVTARIIRNRGIEGEAAIDRYLNGTLDDLYDPMLLKDMDRAVSILCEAVILERRYGLSVIMILTASARRTYYYRHLNGWAVMWILRYRIASRMATESMNRSSNRRTRTAWR